MDDTIRSILVIMVVLLISDVLAIERPGHMLRMSIPESVKAIRVAVEERTADALGT
jgi:hypothetical protein